MRFLYTEVMNQELIYIAQIALALLLGGVVGFERRADKKEAGPRTLGLVTMGSTLFTLISLYGFSGHELQSGVDVSRIMSQIVVGVGFLGAGMIVFRDDKIRGLTTSASVWLCAAIGMAVGVGWYWTAIVSTALVMIVLYLLGHLIPPVQGKED